MSQTNLAQAASRPDPQHLRGASALHEAGARLAPAAPASSAFAVLPVRPDGPPSLDAAANDWHALLNAVKERLRDAATAAPGAPSVQGGAQMNGAATSEASHPLQTVALDCVMVLERLQHRFDGELARRVQHVDQSGHLRDALNRLRLELAGAQAGELRARHQALHDGLTTLPNRAHFHQRLNQTLALLQRQSRPMGLLYLDLDGFKAVNDTYGHSAGDELLRIVAARLRHAVRANDLVGRIGGDEFACLLPDVVDRSQLSLIAHKLLDVVAAAVKIGNVQVSVPASIGIALCPADGVNADDLLRNADVAMYRAKRQHLGFAFFGQPGGG